MRRILTILALLLLSLVAAHAQRPDIKAENDTINMLRSISAKDGLVGQKLSVLFDRFKTLKVPIRFFEVNGTSPWIDPDGQSYASYLYVGNVSNEDAIDRVNTGRLPPAGAIYVEFEGPYNITVEDFDKLTHYDDENFSMDTRTFIAGRMFTIKDVDFVYLTWKY